MLAHRQHPCHGHVAADFEAVVPVKVRHAIVTGSVVAGDARPSSSKLP